MSIPHAVPAQLPQWIFAFGSRLTWDTGMTVSTSLEAAFYHTLQGCIRSTEKIVNWIRETSIAHINTIQIIFNTANAAIVLIGTKKLFDELYGKFSLTPKELVLRSMPVVMGIGVVVTLGVAVLNRYLPLAPTRQENQVEIAETLSRQQKIANVLHITKLVLNVALACLIQNRFWFAITLAGSTYSLLKNIQLKWITFSRTFPTQFENLPVTQVKATFNMLALPTDASADNCAICLDAQTNMAFCANHVFHQNCMAEVCVQKSDSFVDGARFAKKEARYYTNGVHTHTSYSYSATIPQKNLPACPTCRDIPLQNGCDIRVWDAQHGQFNATVNITRPPVDRQYLFENLYAIYNTAQAGLAFLQTYPELAAMILKVQKVMMVTDCIGYALTAYYLYNKVNEKYNRENSTTFKLATVAALVATAAVSYLAILQLNAYLRPALVLKEMLNQLGLSTATIDISGNAPLYFQRMQALYLNRIVTTIALAFFSEQRKTNLWSAATQIMSFVGISRLQWIELTQTLEQPLAKIVEGGGKLSKYVKPNDVSTLKTTTHFLIDRSCTSHLESTLRSIYNYVNTFFDKSSWHSYWMVSYRNGVETGRKFYYDITLQNNPIEPCGCTLTPNLTDYVVKVVDAIQGNVNVSIQT